MHGSFESGTVADRNDGTMPIITSSGRSQDGPSQLKKRSAERVEPAEVDTCRICRSEGTETEELFYPCKCSGSIRYVHQEW